MAIRNQQTGRDMIKITDAAQHYFARLIEQQDEEDLGLRISVNQPGTPGASQPAAVSLPSMLPSASRYIVGVAADGAFSR